MAYKTEDLYKSAIELCKDDSMHFIDDIVANLPCSRQTFYDHFPLESDKLDSIKEALNQNKIKVKEGLRKKWNTSDNATLQISLYKLIGNDEERKNLSQSYHDHTTGGEKLNDIKLSDDQIDKILDKL